MKKILVLLSLLISVHAFAATTDNDGTGDIGSGDVRQEEDLRSSKSFVESCPLDYLTYFDKHEGGPGAYCQCPDEKVSYSDKSEGGPGWYCAK